MIHITERFTILDLWSINTRTIMMVCQLVVVPIGGARTLAVIVLRLSNLSKMKLFINIMLIVAN